MEQMLQLHLVVLLSLASALTNGDIVEAVAFGTFSVASLNADNLDSGTVPDARELLVLYRHH